MKLPLFACSFALASLFGLAARADTIVLKSGEKIVGKVIKVDDNYAEIEIAQGVKVKAVKSTIGDVIPPGGTPAND